MSYLVKFNKRVGNVQQLECEPSTLWSFSILCAHNFR